MEPIGPFLPMYVEVLSEERCAYLLAAWNGRQQWATAPPPSASASPFGCSAASNRWPTAPSYPHRQEGIRSGPFAMHLATRRRGPRTHLSNAERRSELG